MCAASSAVKVQSVLIPVADRTGLYKTLFNIISIRPDRFLKPQADPWTWVPGSPQPATISGVRLHEAILKLRNLSGDSVSETIPANLLRHCPGPGDLCPPGGFPGPGYHRPHTVADI